MVNQQNNVAFHSFAVITARPEVSTGVEAFIKEITERATVLNLGEARGINTYRTVENPNTQEVSDQLIEKYLAQMTEIEE